MSAIKTKPKSEGKNHTHCLDMLPGLMFDDLRFSWIAEVENLRSLWITQGVMLAQKSSIPLPPLLKMLYVCV